MDIVHFDNSMAEEARCALALSRISGQPLLFKGDDFTRANAQNALDPQSA